MRRAHPGVCLILLFAGMTMTSRLVAAAGTGITGQWQQSDYTGMRQISAGCAWISYLTRKLTIDTAPDGSLVGVYSNYEQAVWSLRADPNCAFEAPTMSKALFQRARIWPVRLVNVGAQRWKVIASPAKCTGDSCMDPNLYMAEFETEIKLDGTELLERRDGSAGGGDQLRWRRTVQAMKLSENAASALTGLMKPLDAGECNGFYAQSVHQESPLRGHQSDFCNVRRQMRSLQTQPVTGSTIANSVALDRVVQANGQSESTADVLVTGAAVFQDGSTLPRIVVLRQQQGAWRVFALFAH